MLEDQKVMAPSHLLLGVLITHQDQLLPDMFNMHSMHVSVLLLGVCSATGW